MASIMAEKIHNNQLDEYINENGSSFENTVFDLIFPDMFDEETMSRIQTEGMYDAGTDYIFYTFDKSVFYENSDLDGKKDLIIDIHVVQTKNTTEISSDVPNKFLEFANTCINLIGSSDGEIEYPEHYNEEVIENIKRIRELVIKYGLKNEIRIKFYYIGRFSKARLKCAKDLIGRFNTLKKTVVGSEAFKNCSSEIVTIDQLKEVITKGKSFEYLFENVENFKGDSLNDNTGLISLIPIKQFFEFITDDDNVINEKLFDSNIRDFKGRSTINKAIADTLREPGKIDFWWLNNGITITTEESTYNPVTKQIEVKNPQIVNGLQTSYSIGAYFRENPDKIKKEKRKVFVKFLEFKDDIVDLELDVIVATNRQNEIRDKDIHANDQVQKNIEEFLLTKNKYYQRKDKYYTNRGKKSEDIVKLEDMAKYLNTILRKDPAGTRNNPGKLTKGTKYESLFDIENDNQDYNRYYNVYLMYSKVNEHSSGTIELLGEEFPKVNFQHHIVFMTVVNKLENLDYKPTDLHTLIEQTITKSDVDESFADLTKIIESDGMPATLVLKNIKETHFNKSIYDYFNNKYSK